jgi:DNA polymerase III delta prime subunit
LTQSQPPITRTTHTLPFNKLSPRDFERLCLWLVEREGYERAEHLGAAGSEQGRDIVAWREGALWAFQCKRVQSFGPKDVLKEVEKVLALPEAERPVGLVFLVTCDVSANARQQARARCAGEMECHFWAGTELDKKVKRYLDILEEFFQPTRRNVIQRILGIGLDEQRAQRNRRAMLQLVRNTWVKGVLEQSLHGAAMIELGLEERADAVERPWDMVLQRSDQPNRPLPPSTKIVDVFDEMNRALLILGEPGSGKTTMLLELARDTIARAEDDLTQPIPAVFNLSSWADKRQSIAEWLVDELNAKYNVPKKIARPWVENDDLLLLLDGLDEVKLEHREACVKAVNDFRLEHGLTSLVACSRIADYEALTTRLKLQGAVLLQPLTPQQVDQYLEGTGTELLAVRKTLQYDTTLQELAQSPLMLSVMTLAYQGMSVEDLGSLDSIEARRKHVFDTYMQRMFERRKADKRYSPEQTTRWLVWLAQKMSQHAQSVFIIERLQPNWLQTHNQRRLYAIGSRMTIGLLVGLLGGLLLGLLGGLFGALITPGVGLLDGLFLGLIFGSIAGLFFGLAGLLNGLIAGLINIRKFAEESVNVVEALEWSWAAVRNEMKKRTYILLREVRNPGALSDPFVVQLRLATQLADAFYAGLRSVVIEERVGFRRGIRQSIKCATIGGLVGALYGVIYGLSIGIVVGITDVVIVFVSFFAPSNPLYELSLSTLATTLVFLSAVLGPVSGLVGGLRFGGLAFIQHFTIRFILWLNGHIPWNYARFLDYAAERIFLRKAGGGYIFVHRLLQEYFAALDQGR